MDATATGIATHNGPSGPSWLAVAVRALAILARHDGTCPSAAIAREVQPHAVFLRRVMSQLARSGIVEAREGRDGGYNLARPISSITLADVYRAVNAASPIQVHPVNFDTRCPGSAAMQAAMTEIAHEAETRVLEVLERHTIADVLARADELRPALQVPTA